MNPYLDFVKGVQEGVSRARSLSVTGIQAVIESDRKVLLFSPHPDDECIDGTLPRRLQQELGYQVIDIPVTFGSREDRQHARAQELSDACAYLGWGIHREEDTVEAMEVNEAVAVLRRFNPDVICFPHDDDWNSRHISTHHLVVEALRQMPSDFSCTVIETEFWGAMKDPNLMVEADADTVADLVAATSLHIGEVARNPYHLLLPAWMQDNVRRGGELVSGQGGAAPAFSFATLYRLRRWQDNGLHRIHDRGMLIPAGEAALRSAHSWI